MAENITVAGVYDPHAEAQATIKELQSSGFDMNKLSIVGKDYHTEKRVIGYDKTFGADYRACCWGRPSILFRASVPS